MSEFLREGVGTTLTGSRTWLEITKDLGTGLSMLMLWLGRERDADEHREAPIDPYGDWQQLRRDVSGPKG